MYRQDIQWWAGAIACGLGAAAAFTFGHHPWDAIVGFAAAFLAAFSMYKVTPGDSVKKDAIPTKESV